MFPGTANSFLPCCLAYLAVINAPEPNFASITRTPRHKAEIILFLCGNVNLLPWVSGEYSEIKQPLFFTIFLSIQRKPKLKYLPSHLLSGQRSQPKPPLNSHRAS